MKPKRRPMVYTPGFRFDEIAFEPTREEKLLEWIRAKQRIWAQRDDNARRKLCRELIERVRRDKALQDIEEERQRDLAELQAAHDRRIEQIKAYYEAEHQKEAAAADAKRRAALERITTRIDRDKQRTERETLLRRGVLRGRMGPESL